MISTSSTLLRLQKCILPALNLHTRPIRIPLLHLLHVLHLFLVHFNHFLLELGIDNTLRQILTPSLRPDPCLLLHLALMNGLGNRGHSRSSSRRCRRKVVRRLRRHPLAIILNHILHLELLYLLRIDYADCRLVLLVCGAVGVDHLLEAVELHHIILPLLLQNLIHLPLIDLVRVVRHHYAQHSLAGPLPNIDDVVDVDVLLPPQVALTPKIEPEIQSDLSPPGPGLAQIIEQSTVDLLTEKVLDGVAAHSGLQHVDDTVRLDQGFEFLLIVVNLILTSRGTTFELVLVGPHEAPVARGQFQQGELFQEAVSRFILEKIKHN